MNPIIVETFLRLREGPGYELSIGFVQKKEFMCHHKKTMHIALTIKFVVVCNFRNMS